MSYAELPSLRELPAAETLTRGFRSLNFPLELEAEFRTDHLQSARAWVRMAVAVALATTLGFAVIDHYVLTTSRSQVPDLVRFGLQLPIVIVILMTTSRRFYARWYLPSIQIFAPLFGLGTVAMAVYAMPNYVPLVGARLLLVTFFFYFLLGLRFRVALRCNLIVLGVYVIAGLRGSIPSGVAIYTIWTLICANTIGSAGAYALEYANRLAFLERRLLAEVARHDGLTGLMNRAAFEEQAPRLWQQAARDRVPLSFLMIDLDHFKAYNDHYGHPAGDDCLRAVANSVRVASRRRPLDLVARYGGEEIIAILFGADRSHAEDIGRGIVAAVAELNLPHAASATQPYVTVSIGTATCYPHRDDSQQAGVQLADQALYAAKEQGRNSYVCLAT
jgi:diguanylate cyclase (GGDEF)-like protein